MYETDGEFEQHDDFEAELREGLRLREAPAGFAARVVAAASQQPGVVRGTRSRLAPTGLSKHALSASGMMRWAIAAALLLAVGLGGYTERERRIAGERAREQVFLALRITSSTLQAVHNKVVDSDADEHER